MLKKFILISMLLVGFALGYVFYLSLAIGFAISKFCGGKEEAKQGRIGSIILPWRKYELHLHHWLLSSLAGAACAATGFFLFAPALFYGFLGGLVLQGVYCYNDWHRIIRRRVASVSKPRLSRGPDISRRLKEIRTVAIDAALLVNTSSRRLQRNLIRGTTCLRTTTLPRLLLNMDRAGWLSLSHAMGSLSHRLPFAPALASLMLLFSMFYASDSALAAARPLTTIVQSGTAVSEELIATGRAIRNLIPGTRHTPENRAAIERAHTID